MVKKFKNCAKYLLKKWWFYPAVIAYLLFGVWFGSQSYKAYSYPVDSERIVRTIFFPADTMLKNGLVCNRDNSSDCFLKMTNWKFNFFSILQPSKVDSFAKPIYITMISVAWPVKIITNIAALVLLMMIAFISIVYLIIYLVIIIIFTTLVLATIKAWGIAAALFSLLL